jgi:hypothetical protein
MISTIFFWLLFQFVEIFPSIDFVSFPFYFVWNMGNMEEIGTLRITSTPAKFDSDGCQDLSLQVAAGGEGNKPKQIFVVPKYMYSLYLIIRGLILSLRKGEGYRAHTLVVEILCIPQLFNYLV